MGSLVKYRAHLATPSTESKTVRRGGLWPMGPAADKADCGQPIRRQQRGDCSSRAEMILIQGLGFIRFARRGGGKGWILFKILGFSHLAEGKFKYPYI